ncbi:MAG: hypothetical protein ABF868_10875 [Sporolactobacillus sp.]
MPFHQKVNNDARLTKMIEDLGITLHSEKKVEKIGQTDKINTKDETNK